MTRDQPVVDAIESVAVSPEEKYWRQRGASSREALFFWGYGGLSSRMNALWLTLRSLFWALLLPGVFAGYIPWRYFGLSEVHLDFRDPVQLIGLLSVAAGVLLLLACIWEFAHSGRGTLAPVDPPRDLVVRGLYCFVRNPMYLSVTSIVLGEVMLTRSRGLFLYWVIWFAVVNVFVMGYEEPTLRKRFGPSYDDYSRRVGRWLPRLG